MAITSTSAERLSASAASAPPLNLSLAPYTGAFERPQAYHLLRRATFGTTAARVDDALGLGLDATLDRLVADDDFAALPVNVFGTGDPNVPVGETWVNAPYVDGYEVRPYRQNSLQAWQMRSYVMGGFSAQAKLSLFWHNRFGVARDNADARLFYRYLATCRRLALGNVRELLGAITIDGAMLRFLNANENVVGSPNENFARELLELFTLGKGPAAGPGDYTTYTETDVRELARALTGWTVRGINSTNPDLQPEGFFLPQRHDTTAKQLSARLGGASLGNAGEEEYQRVLDVVFAQPTMGDDLVRELYRYLVHYDITPAIEAEVIQPLATRLRADGFAFAPTLRTLLGSEHFFDVYRRGGLIQSPIEFNVAALAGLGIPPPADNLRAENMYMFRLVERCGEQQQIPSQPPTVAGWKAYYQAPLYHRTWISATTLAARGAFTEELTRGGWEVTPRLTLQADVLSLVEDFPDPYDPDLLIEELAERLLPEPLSTTQITALKAVLLPGLPDFEWTVEYQQYRDDPSDQGLAAGLQAKLRSLAATMLTAAEAHLA